MQVRATSRISSPRWLSLGKGLILGSALIVFSAWTVIPFFWMIITAIKPNSEIYRETRLLPRHPTFQHFVELMTQTNFLTYLRNSVIVAIGTTTIAIVVGSLAAYALTRLTFRGRALLANATIVTYLMPPALLFIPLFQVAFQFHLTNKAVGLIPIYLIGAAPFSTWMAMAYFATIPKELEEAALVDGATRWQILWQVITPLALPAIAVIALFTFTQAWNEFLFALLLISSESQKTIPVGLAELIIGDVFQWGPLMAGALIASLIPTTIYLIAQRWIISGLLAGAVKQ